MKEASKEFFAALGWLLSTMGTIFARQPRALLATAFLLVVLKIVQFLVMMLPLKVVLLAGSAGVPRYMPFIDPEHKFGWIVGLAAGTVIAYILSQVLDIWATRLSESAGTQLMRESTDLNFLPNQEGHARSIFFDFASLAASVLFWAIGMAIYALIATTTFLTYSGLVVASLSVGYLLFVARDVEMVRRARSTLVDNTGVYLRSNSILIFFICFFVILSPYFLGQEFNVLAALIAIILLRRTLTAISEAIRGAIKIVSSRRLVDTLIYRNRRLVPQHKPSQQTLARVFKHDQRLELVNDMLAAASVDKTVTTVQWQDPVVRGIYIFMVSCTDGSHYQLQAYATARDHNFANENVLFAILTREAVGAPEIVAEVEHDNFKCRLLAASEGREPTGPEWKGAQPAALERLISIKPAKELVDIYRSTHLHPHQKLTAEFINRVEVAICGDDEADLVSRFISQLETLHARMDAMPLALANTDFSRAAAMANGEELPLFMYWGRWSLEPLGGGVMFGLDDGELQSVLDGARAKRNDIADTITLADLKLTARIQFLVAEIERGNYAAAIRMIATIMEVHASERLLAAAE